MVGGVLFDFGNTLFAHAPLAVTIEESAARVGLQISRTDAYRIAARIDAAAMTSDELARQRDLDATVWRRRWQVLYALADDWGEGLGTAIYESMHAPSEWIPYSHSAATLQSLHAHGVAVGIVSNTGWDVRAVFAAHAMFDSVSSFTLSYEAGFVKPDHGIFDAACVSLGLEPTRVMMVGDDPIADSGAVRAGIRTLLLPPVAPGLDNGVAGVLRLIGIDE